VVNTPTTKAEVKPVAQAVVAPVVVTNQSNSVDLDKLAYAVAMAETKDCTTGIGPKYLNCFGIKSGGTAPCSAIGRSRFCIYNSKEESYEAFKIIWTKVYGGGYPTRAQAERWTGKDRVDNWLRIVNQYYNA
jgi:hypothetical protein